MFRRRRNHERFHRGRRNGQLDLRDLDRGRDVEQDDRTPEKSRDTERETRARENLDFGSIGCCKCKDCGVALV